MKEPRDAASVEPSRWRATRVRLLVAGIAAAAAAAGFVAASADSGDQPAAGPTGFAVLDRPETADDRKAREPNLIELVTDGRVEGQRAKVRLLRWLPEGIAVVIVYEKKAKTPRGTSTEFCLSYVDYSLANVQCGDLAAMRRGTLASSGQAGETDGGIDEARDLAMGKAELTDADGRPVPTHFYGVVPDAVVRVEATFSGGIPSAKGTVKNNFYDVTSSHPEASNRDGDVRWFDRDGKLVAH